MARCLAAGLIRRGVALAVLWGLAVPAWAADGAPRAEDRVSHAAAANRADALLDFDIPTQALATALDRYAGTTHLSIVIPSDMVHGRMSSAVRGRFSSESALRQLLAGTGLVAERQDSLVGTTYLLAEDGKPGAPSRPGRAVLFDHAGYAGMIQSRIWQVLCADSLTAPGPYRLVFKFQIDAAGHLADPHLFASTGNTRRDSAVLDALRRVSVEPPPPPLVRQSLLMSLLPGDAQGSFNCGPGAS